MIAGRYTLETEIGRGGMGVVWRGTDRVLGRTVALKRIGRMPGATDTDLARAEREARLAASLNHPHVVAVFDLVTDGDERWLVMEYVVSRNLAQLVRERGPLSEREAAALLAQAADALAAAHRAGIVHRDVKPSNILVTEDNQVKLTDFGIARSSTDLTLTQTGMMTGSPAYLSPEVASGLPATSASDVWALGATLFHALTGAPPYDVQGNVVGALYQIVHEEPPRPAGVGPLLPLLEATMATRPADRWPMGRVSVELHRQADGRPALDEPDHRTRRLAAPPAGPDPEPSGPDPTVRTRPVPPVPDEPVPPARTSGPPPERRGRPGTEGRGRRRLLVGLALIALLVVGGVSWRALTGPADDTAATPGAGSTSSSDPSPGTSSDTATEGPTEAELVAFVRDYLATVTTDPRTAWDMLTPGFQDSSGGFSSYSGFWSTITSAQPSNITADADALTVSYDVTYRKAGGGTSSDQVTLRLEDSGGDLRISGES